MLNTRFGIEIEMTGLTKNKAAGIVADVVKGEVTHSNDAYDSYFIKMQDGRNWRIMHDSSIKTQKKIEGTFYAGGNLYSVELVSPILTYTQDIEQLQEIVRVLRKAGTFTNNTCGIHIHIDGVNHDAKTLRNFVNLIYSRNDLFYKALNIDSYRSGYCKKLEKNLVTSLNEKKPTTLEEFANIWYQNYFQARTTHYHQSRYHFLNLHSFFNGHHTVEIRGFNSTLHAGEIRSYIVFALALNHQALTQKSASIKQPQLENEKFAMRTYLNRIGLSGPDFKACRLHLIKYLTGSAAWRFSRVA